MRSGNRGLGDVAGIAYAEGMNHQEKGTFACGDVQYSRVPPDHQRQVLQEFCSLPWPLDERRELDHLRAEWERSRRPLDGLFVARREGQLVGAAWFQETPGATAQVGPARGPAEPSEESLDGLQRWMDEQLQGRRPLRFAQAVLSDPLCRLARRLLRCGYSHAAEIGLLVGFCGDSPAAWPTTRWQFERYDGRTDRPRLADVLERTYQGTLDIPAADGLRTIDEVLKGYEQAAGRCPDHWYLVRDRTRPATRDPVGCLLLQVSAGQQPGQEQCELVYMGLEPSARGQGGGLELVRAAHRLATQAGCVQLVLAVDLENEPAMRIYQAAGLQAMGRCSLWLKPLHPANSH